MGNQPSFPILDANKLDTWRIRHVEIVQQQYLSEDSNYDFGVTREDFNSLLASIDGCTTLGNQLWAVLDPKRAGMVATLEGIAALAVGCTDSMDLKLNFIFKHFDFKRDGDMSHDEVVIMLSSTLSAMAKMEKSGILPGDDQMEKLADDLFLDADADKDGTIQRKEFLNWAKSKIAAQIPKEGEQVFRTDVLTSFGLLPEAPSRPIAAKAPEPAAATNENSDNSNNENNSDAAPDAEGQ